MTPDTASRPAEVPTRRAVLDLLKRLGPRDAGDLAAELGLSAMAVRQHLYALRDDRLVTFAEQPRPIGRPAKLWRLTAAADRYFPDAHAELTVALIESMRHAFGDDGIHRLLTVRSRAQIATYAGRVDRRASLRHRLSALAEIRSEEGYMAEVRDADDGAYLLIENHCPVCRAAAACTGLCAAELTVFRAVLGPDVEIARTDHILAGARRCAYRVIGTASPP